ncbi:MAG: thiolase family protein [Chloroflexi bacterium]|nr:thiolase family protein [Chloroflexota bacterium]
MRQATQPRALRDPDTQAVIWGELRSAFAVAHRGALKDTRPDDLLVELMNAHQHRHPAYWQSMHTPHDMVVGCAYPEGEQGYNVARTVALGAGLAIPAMTVNRLCGSALEAAAIAASAVSSGRAPAWVVAGVESMSRVPRRGANFSESARICDTAIDTYITMGETAERVAHRYPHLSRTMQEAFAATSHTNAHQAWQHGWYANHVICPPSLTHDESVRYPVNHDKMAALAPAFRDDGVVTAATSSPMSDGASMALVTNESTARTLAIPSFLRILDITTAHVAPDVMGMGPVPAIKALLARNDISMRDIAAVELNEAFAIQVLACIEELSIPPAIVNTWGGAIAIGHPLGASGLRLLMTLHARMNAAGQRNQLGIASLCVGGGQGIAMLCQLVFP